MIGIDWGTTHLRAYRLNADGTIQSAKASPTGIMSIAGSDFETPLAEILADWNEVTDREILMSGMVGSRQGVGRGPVCPLPRRTERPGCRSAARARQRRPASADLSRVNVPRPQRRPGCDAR